MKTDMINKNKFITELLELLSKTMSTSFQHYE